MVGAGRVQHGESVGTQQPVTRDLPHPGKTMASSGSWESKSIWPFLDKGQMLWVERGLKEEVGDPRGMGIFQVLQAMLDTVATHFTV